MDSFLSLEPPKRLRISIYEEQISINSVLPASSDRHIKTITISCRAEEINKQNIKSVETEIDKWKLISVISQMIM